MKRTMKFLGAAVLVFGAAALGLSMYISQDQRGEVAGDAIAAVAGAAARLTADRTEYTVVVANRVGEGRVGVDREIPMSVQAVLSVRGSGRLAHICATMPRVRDAINGAITDRIVPKLRAGRTLSPDELAADGEILRAALNRLVKDNAVADVRLTLRSAFEAQESGCTDANKAA